MSIELLKKLGKEMPKKTKIAKLILRLILAITLIFIIPVLFYNVLVDPDAIGGGSIVFLAIPVIITMGLGIYILYRAFKRLRK